MKYIGTIYMDASSSARSFDTPRDAEHWLDEQNNNLEYATKVDIVDDKWNVVDSYWYTEAAQ